MILMVLDHTMIMDLGMDLVLDHIMILDLDLTMTMDLALTIVPSTAIHHTHQDLDHSSTILLLGNVSGNHNLKQRTASISRGLSHSFP